MSKIKTIDKKLIGQYQVGWLSWKHFRFSQVRQYLDKDGTVSCEIPETRDAFLIRHGKQQNGIWLSSDEVRDLFSLLEQGPHQDSKVAIVKAGGDVQ